MNFLSAAVKDGTTGTVIVLTTPDAQRTMLAYQVRNLYTIPFKRLLFCVKCSYSQASFCLEVLNACKETDSLIDINYNL